MSSFGWLDLVAVATFLTAWLGYHAFVELLSSRGRSLNSIMNEHRVIWMQTMAQRDNRMLDAITGQALTNGTAFFASNAVLAVGACFALLGASDEALTIFSTLPLGIETDRTAYDTKVLGLAVIFIYAFFKFAWSYRLFNYCAILIGAVPIPGSGIDPAPAVERAARMNIEAAMHFNRGLRAFFFALAYLGWFVSPAALILSTVAVLIVLLRRQYLSRSLQAASHGR